MIWFLFPSISWKTGLRRKSINHVFQLDRTGACFNITAKDYICPTGAMYSQEMWYSAHALFIFTFFFHQLSSWSLLLEMFCRVLGHQSLRVLCKSFWKKINQYCSQNNQVNIYMFQLWVGGFTREGGEGGRRQPLQRRKITATLTHLYFRQFWTISAFTTDSVWVFDVWVWCGWCVRYFYRLVLMPCRCSASVLVLRCVLCCLVEGFIVHQFLLPHPSTILWHRFKVCASFKESWIQQPCPPSTGQRAPPAHRNAKQ